MKRRKSLESALGVSSASSLITEKSRSILPKGSRTTCSSQQTLDSHDVCAGRFGANISNLSKRKLISLNIRLPAVRDCVRYRAPESIAVQDRDRRWVGIHVINNAPPIFPSRPYWKVTCRSGPLLPFILLDEWHEEIRIVRWKWVAKTIAWLLQARAPDAVVTIAMVERYWPGKNVIPLKR